MKYQISGAASASAVELRSFYKKLSFQAEDSASLLKKISSMRALEGVDLADFRRGSPRVRQAILAAAAALEDAGKKLPSETGLIGYGTEGALVENRAYFADYVQYGRELGRGALFVPTLPTIPVCEVSISFHFQGPAYYFSGDRNLLQEELVLAEYPLMLIHFQKDLTTVFVLEERL